jgi:hypothetical protein
MSEKLNLIRIEERRYYHRQDGGIIMKIEEKTFVGMRDGEEIWETKTTTIPLIEE